MNSVTSIVNCASILEDLSSYIEKLKYKRSVIIDSLGYSRPTFYKKLREKTFTIKDLLVLAEYLWPGEIEKVEDEILLELMLDRKKNAEYLSKKETEKLFTQ